jgi:hypothetical protein
MNGDPDWEPIITADTSWHELDAVVDRATVAHLADFEAQLQDDPDWSEREIARVLAAAAPLIRRQNRAALESGGKRLQH